MSDNTFIFCHNSRSGNELPFSRSARIPTSLPRIQDAEKPSDRQFRQSTIIHEAFSRPPEIPEATGHLKLIGIEQLQNPYIPCVLGTEAHFTIIIISQISGGSVGGPPPRDSASSSGARRHEAIPSPVKNKARNRELYGHTEYPVTYLMV